MASEARPPGGSRGHAVTKSRKRARSAEDMSTSSSSRSANGPPSASSFAPCSLLTRLICCRSVARSHSIRFSPQRRTSSSGAVKISSDAKGNTSSIPARTAATWRWRPCPNQRSTMHSRNSPRLSTSSALCSPPGRSGERVTGSTKHAAEDERYSSSPNVKARFRCVDISSALRMCSTASSQRASPLRPSPEGSHLAASTAAS
mmetsp:Transcript_63058/g.150432  ORF Transcript_63058/g.150432 Transcript_63058/m.150432 type:complete len:203 (-) Transcript_63058:1028-1636(-)